MPLARKGKTPRIDSGLEPASARAEMTEYDKLSAARLAEKGYITVENGRPSIPVPLFNKEQHAAFIDIIDEALADIGAKSKLESVHEAIVSICKKLVPPHFAAGAELLCDKRWTRYHLRYHESTCLFR